MQKYLRGAPVWVSYSRRPARKATVVRDDGGPVVQVEVVMVFRTRHTTSHHASVVNVGRDRLTARQLI